MTDREIKAAFAPLLQYEHRVTRALVHAVRAADRRPTSLRAQRVGLLQLERARLNAQFGLLNAEADQHARELAALAFGHRRKGKPRPKPAEDEEERNR